MKEKGRTWEIDSETACTILHSKQSRDVETFSGWHNLLTVEVLGFIKRLHQKKTDPKITREQKQEKDQQKSQEIGVRFRGLCRQREEG